MKNPAGGTIRILSNAASYLLIVSWIRTSTICPAGDNEQLFMERLRPWIVGLSNSSKEDFMKITIIALSAAALIASAPAVFAQGSSGKAPGQEMQEKGSAKGSPGASGSAPGHEMQEKGSKKGTEGASGYAPGQTSGSSSSGTSGPNSTTTKSK
jgi:hypothetical protein